jgi:hypothetical protein
VWKDNGTWENFNGMLEAFFSKISKSFGIKSIDWADGDKWQILPTPMTLAKKRGQASR